MSIEAVLFDLDGTLVDTERQAGEAMSRALLAEAGVAVDDADRHYIIGKSWVDIHRHLCAKYEGLRWTVDELIERTARLREGIFEAQGLTALPGVDEVMARFAELPKAVVTGSSRAEAEHALHGLGLWSSFVAVYAAEDVPSSKPNPEGYLMAAKACQVKAERCLVIEDSVPGIAAGRAAGALVVAVRAGNFAGHDQSEAHHIVDRIDQVTWDLLAKYVEKTGP